MLLLQLLLLGLFEVLAKKTKQGLRLEPGWRVVSDKRCSNDDDDFQCERLVPSGICAGEGEVARKLISRPGSKQTVEKLTIEFLARCRRSCREHYANYTELPRMIQLYGGLGEDLVNPFGFPVG